jgi:polyisoprenoid-binding protein YceI
MTTGYRFDPNLSRFTVQALATGLLSFAGHSATFAVRQFSGTVTFEGGRVEGMQVEVVVQADSLELLDEVRPADRHEIESRMRAEVLETARFPQIAVHSNEVWAEAIAQGLYRLRIGGRLELRGVVRPHQAGAELLVFSDGIRLAGECPLHLSAHGVRPVTALAGAIRLKDELRVAFDVAAVPQEQ